MSTDWVTPFLFRRYCVSAFNCWDLVCEVYRNQLGITLDAYSGVDPRDPLAVGQQMDLSLTRWHPCDENEYLAIAPMSRRRSPFHVGVVVAPGKILHVAEGCNACVQTPAALLSTGFHRIHYYRHAQSIPHSQPV